MNIFKNDEYSSFLNIFIFLDFKHNQFTSFISLFRPLGYPIKPRPFFFPCRKSGYRSWVIPLYSILLLSEPMSTRLLNSISSRICHQNTQFNMYTTTSKQQEGCTLKDSHPKCFITTNFDKFHREAFARRGESR